MNLIVAVDNNWAIGSDNDLLIKIPEDQKYFRQHTTGKVIVMGRKTFESLPGKKPLKDRVNIVLTRTKDYKIDGAQVYNSVADLMGDLKAYKSEDIYIVGGGTIYEQFLDFCSMAYVTKFDASPEADTFFPNLDEKEEWKLYESKESKHLDLEFTFNIYKKNK